MIEWYILATMISILNGEEITKVVVTGPMTIEQCDERTFGMHSMPFDGKVLEFTCEKL